MAKAHTGNPVAKSKFARTNKVGLAQMIITLKDGEAYSYEDLMETTGFSRRVIVEWIVAFRRQKLVRIASWLPDARRIGGVAQFAWDETMKQTDCKKPTQPRAQIKQRSLDKAKHLAMLSITAGRNVNERFA